MAPKVNVFPSTDCGFALRAAGNPPLTPGGRLDPLLEFPAMMPKGVVRVKGLPWMRWRGSPGISSREPGDVAPAIVQIRMPAAAGLRLPRAAERDRSASGDRARCVSALGVGAIVRYGRGLGSASAPSLESPHVRSRRGFTNLDLPHPGRDGYRHLGLAAGPRGVAPRPTGRGLGHLHRFVVRSPPAGR